MKTLTHAQLKELLHYNPDTGVFTRIKHRNSNFVGKVAGSNGPYGHWQVGINYKVYSAQRLAWFYVHGSWPAGEVDHINCIPLDNRIENLRVVDRTTNRQNVRRAQKNNLQCGLLGVTRQRGVGRWKAGITSNGKFHYLGRFDTPELAHAAYINAKRQFHAGCTI